MEKAQGVLAIIIGIGLGGFILALFGYGVGTLQTATVFNTTCTVSNEVLTTGLTNNTINFTARQNLVPSTLIIKNNTLASAATISNATNYTVNYGNGTIRYIYVNVSCPVPGACFNSTTAYADYSYTCESPVSASANGTLNQIQNAFLTTAAFLIVFAVLGLIGMFLGMFGGYNGPKGGREGSSGGMGGNPLSPTSSKHTSGPDSRTA